MVLTFGLFAVPNASADTFALNQIFCNCLTAGSTAGTVVVASLGANSAQITVQLNAGLSFHDTGLDSFAFNGPAGLTAANFTINNSGGSTWTFQGNSNAGPAGSFLYEFECASAPNGCAGTPAIFQFTVNFTGIGSNLSLLETTNSGASNVDFAANIAVQGTSGCTGMVGGGIGTQPSTPSGGINADHLQCTSTPPPPQTPEPASLLLLGTGLATAAYRLKQKKGQEGSNESAN
jgi:hypothetical protein